MNLEEILDSSDRSVHAALDVALGRAFRALTEHEQSILITLHAGLHGPDRSIVEIITKGIPISVALSKIVEICETPVIANSDPTLARAATDATRVAQKIVNRRNELAHQIIQPTDDDAREFSLFKATSEVMMSEISVDSLDRLRKRARESTTAMYAIARRILIILHDLPAGEPTGHFIRVYARDTGRT